MQNDIDKFAFLFCLADKRSMYNIIHNSFKIVCISLSLSLFFYIFTGFLRIFVHDIGPLSALLGAVASLITCGIAIRAIFLAKQWHTDKFKAEIFDSARDALHLISLAPVDVAMLHQQLRSKVQLLNLLHSNADETEKNIILLQEIAEYREKNQESRQKRSLDVAKCLRYKKWIHKKYTSHCAMTLRTLSKINSQLNTPLELLNGQFIIDRKLEDYIKAIKSENYKAIRNELAETKVSEFMLLDDALKEINSQIKLLDHT